MTTSVVDLPALRAYLVAHAVPGADDCRVLPDGSSRHRRLVRSGAGWVPCTLTLPSHPVGEVEVSARAGAKAEERADVLDAGRRWAGLDVDPAEAVAALADDTALGPLVSARPHVRVPGATDPLEAAVGVVLGQHVSLAAGRVFAARLVAAHGVGSPGGAHGGHEGTRADGGLLRFPDAEVLATLDPHALRATVGITGARARTVVALAHAVADGLDLSPTTDPERRAEVRRALLDLPGVGPWTADLVALRCLRDPDVFLPGDLVLRKALGGVTAGEAARLAERWSPHRSLAVLHLWTHHALDPG